MSLFSWSHSCEQNKNNSPVCPHVPSWCKNSKFTGNPVSSLNIWVQLLCESSGFHLCPELTLCQVLHTQIPPEKSWSPRRADTPESTSETSTSALRTWRPQDTRIRNDPGIGSFQFPSVLQSSPYSNSSQKELVSQEYRQTGLQEGQATVRDSKTS